jgi:hypothetical protein
VRREPVAPAEQAAGPPTVHDGPPGVRVTLPPGWRAVDPDAVAQGFAVLHERLAASPQAIALLARVQQRSVADGLRVFTSGDDQLQLTATAASPPTDVAAARRFCDHLVGNVPVLPGQEMRTWTCDPRTVGGRPALYVERDALLPGTRTLEYWLGRAGGKGVQLVLTCTAARADARRAELAAIAASVALR